MNISKQLILLGTLCIFLGIILSLFNKTNSFGNTSLDYKYIGKNFKFYAPIGSMLIISIFITFIVNLYNKFFK